MDVIDMTGKPCPIPVIEAKRALRVAAPGMLVRLLVDNDAARENLRKMAEGMGCRFNHMPAEDGAILAVIEAPATAAAAPEEAGRGGLVVAVGRDRMGSGDDELGRILAKAFIYSLTEFVVPPERLLLFNGGVRLSVEGSNSLADLKALRDRGTRIDSCGTCLNFYGLSDKLRVGGVTNMHDIAEAMAGAARLVNL